MTMSGQLHGLVTVLQGENGGLVGGGAVTSLGILNNKDLVLLLGSEPWTVQPIAWSLFGLQLLSYIIH